MAKDQDKSADQEARLKRLERVLEQAEAKLLDQNARLDSLGNGREESMRLLGEARADLARVAAERDQLQKRLAAIEGMQTETIALPEEEDEEPGIHSIVPSIDDMMSNLNLSIEETEAQGGRGRLTGQAAEGLDAEWQEMIAPEVMAPEEFGGKANGHDRAAKAVRLLVYMDAAHPIKYPLYKDVMTIGRSESADIQIDGEFISRIHARIVCKDGNTIIEDVGSKNGFKINSEPLAHSSLKHGDVIAIGKLRFTFVDATKS
jgi:hypothetical protein